MSDLTFTQAEAKRIYEMMKQVNDGAMDLQKQIDALKAALDKYGRHLDNCIAWNGYACNCGFKQSLAPAPDVGKEKSGSGWI